MTVPLSLPNIADDGLTVAEASEAEILERILRQFPPAERADIGPGDDAAVLTSVGGRYVVTTDMMIHGPDFRRAWHRPEELGWKAAVTNLADVYAMGARPTGLVLALAATADLRVSDLERFAAGMRAACDALAPGCGVVGGDLSVSATLTIAITAFGDLEGRAPVLRSGARVGDQVALAGDAGLAAEGIDLLFARGVTDAGVPDRAASDVLRETHPEAISAQLTPFPPLAAGIAASEAGATSMMDVSDGLALDASRIARASDVAVRFDTASFGDLDATELERALRGGEDHALLATFPADVRLPEPFRRIGRVVAGSGVYRDDDEMTGTLGWDPYSAWNGQAG